MSIPRTDPFTKQVVQSVKEGEARILDIIRRRRLEIG
jgi:hypothetical protein